MTPTDRPILWTAAEAAEATGGGGGADWTASGVSIDSRDITPGDLFIALEGPRFDGHDYVADALARGAAAALVARRPDRVDAEAPLLVVGDTFDALYDLGRVARDRTTARVIAVTGSVGKTGIKEALRLMLGDQAPTLASLASLNNHWGVPLTLARLPRDAAYAVVEMGMNHAGELTPLSRLARPHVAMVTTIESVHAAHFDSVEAIADAKAEIFAGLEPGGIAVLNRDNPRFGRLAEAARAAGVERIVGFGGGADSEARLLTADPEDGGWRVTAQIGPTLLAYRVPLAARHWALGSVSALAAVVAVGADPHRAAATLADLVAPPGRGRMIEIGLGDGRLRVIDESYNASPVAVAAALDVLGRHRPDGAGRRIAVLGDMLELGDRSSDLHGDLAGPLESAAIDLVFTVGHEMETLWNRLPATRRGGHAATARDVLPLVVGAVRPGDVVMVKGSRGMRTDRIVEVLRGLDGVAPDRRVNGE